METWLKVLNIQNACQVYSAVCVSKIESISCALYLFINHNQIGKMNNKPLFRVRSWTNCMRFMSCSVLIPLNLVQKGCDIHFMVTSGPTATDSPRDVWWTVSRNYTVLFLFRYVKNTNFNQYLPVILMSLGVWDSKFGKLVMFWMWRHHDMALWRHGSGAWHNCLILTPTAEPTLLTTWLDCGNRVIREIWNSGSWASYGPYHWLELPIYGIKLHDWNNGSDRPFWYADMSHAMWFSKVKWSTIMYLFSSCSCGGLCFSVVFHSVDLLNVLI